MKVWLILNSIFSRMIVLHVVFKIPIPLKLDSPILQYMYNNLKSIK